MDLDVLHREFAKLKARVDAITGGVDPGASPPQQYAEPVEQAALELHERVKALEEVLAAFPNFEQTAHLVGMHGSRLDDMDARLKAVEEFAPVLERLREEIARETRAGDAQVAAGTASGVGGQGGAGSVDAGAPDAPIDPMKQPGY